MLHVKALRNKLDDEATDKEFDAAYRQAGGKTGISFTGVARPVIDLQYLLSEGTESSV